MAIGLLAIFGLRDLPHTGARATEPESVSTEPAAANVHPLTVLAAAAIAGCAALMLEMLWARQLALILGGSTYAFSAMLSVLLLGIGLGSVLSARFAAVRFQGPWLTAGLILALCAAAVLGKSQIPPLTEIVGSLRDHRASMPFNSALSLGASAALQLLPAMAMGALFPILVAMWQGTGFSLSRKVGSVYCWNAIGAIVGATITHSLFVPQWGSAQAFAIAICLYAVAGLALLVFGRVRGTMGPILAATAFAALVLIASHAEDPLVTNRGMYLYGYKPVAANRDSTRVLYFREGAACNVLVTERAGARALYVNGKVDASDRGDMPTQLGLAYFPRLLRPAARDVLIIGFGSGTTSGASLLTPHAAVKCCEIEPAVYAASQYFHHVNHRPDQSDRFSII
jgi:spermidine synthase